MAASNEILAFFDGREVPCYAIDDVIFSSASDWEINPNNNNQNQRYVISNIQYGEEVTLDEIFSPLPVEGDGAVHPSQQRPSWLPGDWKVVLLKSRCRGRTDVGSSFTRAAKLYESPDGRRFRSRPEVMHYLHNLVRNQAEIPDEVQEKPRNETNL